MSNQQPLDITSFLKLVIEISQQLKHSRDIAAILRARKDKMDYPYMEKWINQLGLIVIWQEIRNNVS